MQFNSVAFLVFFAVVFPLYCALNFRWQNRMLLAASYLFYGWAEPKFLCLMFLTSVMDYYVGIKIADTPEAKAKKNWLLLSIVVNLVILGFFKYFDFFIVSAQDTLGYLGWKVSADSYLLRLALPVGISFYTFHEISYTVDIYREHIKPARKFEDFAVFISFFPQLVAGPIGRASWQMPQFSQPRRMTWQGWCDGSLLILIGFFKKMVIADSLAPLADRTFSNPEHCSSKVLMLGLYCFAFQIYADFSGYTDIARGLAKVMGFELIENFNQPYYSSNITEFWRRWHISLSTWLRDYLYIPLGGNRHGKFNTYRNLFLTMFLGGFWHGASWQFAIWGSLHGIYLALHKLMMGEGKPVEKKDLWAVKLVKIFITFHLVLLTWIFFRANKIDGAITYLKGIFTHFADMGPSGVAFPKDDLIHGFSALLLMLIVIDLPQYLKKDHCVMLRWPLPLRVAIYAVMFMWIVMMRGLDNVPFIYFQF